MVVNLSAGVKAKLANAKLAQAGSTATVPVPVSPVAQPVNPSTAPIAQNIKSNEPLKTQQNPNQSYDAKLNDLTQWATPTPVAPTSTTPTTVTSQSQPDYQDDSEKRLKEIQMNLDKAAKTNPDIFSNRDTYNQAFKYSDRSQAQKAIVDSAYNSFQQKNQVAQQQQAQLQSQQKMITDLQVMPVQDMVDKWLSQEQVTSLATNNPEKFAQYQKAKEDKIKLDTINGELSKNPMQEIIDKFKNATFEVPQLQEMFTEKMKVLEPQQLELNAKKWELTQIQDEMDNILNDARSELEGTGATDSYIRALASKRMQEITPLYNAKLREYNTILDDYQVKANNIEQEMGFAKDQFTMNQQAQTQQMSQLWFAMELMNYQSPQQKEDSAWNSFLKQQSYMEWDINSTDPAIRKRAIQNAVDWVLKEFEWIPIQRSREQIISDITNQVNSGKDLWTAITESLRKPIMDKPEYQYWKNTKLGISTTPVNIGWYDYTQNSDWSYTPFTAPFDYAGYKWNTTKAPMRTDRNNNPTAMTTDVAKTLGLVEWVDYVQWDVFPNNPNLYSAKLIGDPIQQTIKWLDTAIANGKKAFYTQWGQQRRTHTAMSNEQWSWMTQEQKIATVVKMYHNEWGNGSLIAWLNNWIVNVTTNPSLQPLFDKYMKDWSIPSEKELKWIWLTYWQFVQQAWQAKTGVAPQQATLANDILTAINWLEKSPWLPWAVWFSLQKAIPFVEWPLPWTAAADFVAQFNSFRDNLALANIDKLKGAMSDKDLEFLRNTATALNLSMSEDEFKRNLKALKSKYLQIVSGTTQQDISNKIQQSLQSSYTPMLTGAMSDYPLSSK